VENVIFVLGMHRSGTSAFTRAMRVFGFEFSDDLLTLHFSNPKGHWEPAEVVALNDEILSHYGKVFHSGEPLSPAQFIELKNSFFFGRAVEIINKNAAKNFFCFKDPRTCRLLPFWHGVMRHLNIGYKNIFVIRNPKNSARSFNKLHYLRDEYVYHLWFCHNFEAIMHTDTLSCYASYENLLEHPAQTLRRVAKALGFAITSEELDEFANEFLEHDLAHNEFSYDDVMLDDAFPEYIKDFYVDVNNLCHAEGAGIQAENRRIVDKYGKFHQSVLGLLRTIDEHTKSLQALNSTLGETRATMGARISELTAALGESRSELGRVYASRSWRITRPLRAAAAFVRAGRQG